MNVLIRGIAHIMRKLYRTHSLRYLGYGLNELTSGIQNRLRSEHITIYDYDGNLKISMDPSEHLGNSIFFRGNYEQWDVQAAKSLIKPNDVIVEVGSNIGIWTILFCKWLPAGLVYAIEPSSFFELLKKNLALNNFQNVVVEKIAIGSTEWPYKIIYENHRNAGMNYLVNSPLTTSDGIIESLDHYISTREISKIDFLKLDVEGMELEVLQGGVVTIAKHRPVLFIELEEKNLSRYNSTTQNVLDLLESLGYSEFYISSTYGKLNLIDKKDILKLKAGINIFCIPSNIPN